VECSLAEVFDRVAAAIPERECIVSEHRRLRYADVAARARQLAAFLADRGLTRRALADRPRWESPHDHLAVYLRNGPEYLETMLGAFLARAAPFNVNHRYVDAELRSLLTDAAARAVVYHRGFGPTLARVLPALDADVVLVHVEDGSDAPVAAGSVAYEDAVAWGRSRPLERQPSPDDLYVLYTGGTTGRPKGVLWRQADLLVAALGAVDARTGRERDSLDDLVAAAAGRVGRRVLVVPPLMHGAAQWTALRAFVDGGTVVFPSVVDRLDPADVWRTVAAERIDLLLVVGEAFARPLADELERAPADTPSLRTVLTGGMGITRRTQARLAALLPGVAIVDTVGASEAGAQLRRVGAAAPDHRAPAEAEEGEVEFEPLPGTRVLAEDRASVLAPGHEGVGWLARAGRIPLGYLGDRARTETTFPVVDGERVAVPGDRARHLANGRIVLLGRDSMSVNTGGEKVFVEEVEEALLAHPAVLDVLVVGRPSERWGSEVVAVVRLRAGAACADDELRDWCGSTLARFKVPKAFVRVDEVRRSPAGKADYAWARSVADAAR
jgi:fatty-acyl-CoA synthase